MSKSGKIQDAATAALSAIEEALDLSAPPESTEGVKEPPSDTKDDTSAAIKLDDAGTNADPTSARAPALQPPTPVSPADRPANDDRRTIGELRQALQLPQDRTIMAATFTSMALWTLAWTLYVYFHKAEILGESGSLLSPGSLLALAALVGPVAFLFITGLMARRAHDMRHVANSMTEVAIRLIEPESIATEQVVSLSQAIRREAASMGDGIERALARAGELEVIVRTEVTNLERSYTENERRIRQLIDELTREREAILVNADNARTSLFGARDALSQELAATSAHLAEAVSAAGARVTASLGVKSEEIKIALEKAGDGFETTLSSHGDKVVTVLTRAGDDVAQKIVSASDAMTRGLNDGVEDAGRRLQAKGDALGEDFVARGAGIVEKLETLGLTFNQSISEQGDKLVGRLSETGASIHETIANHGGALDRSLAETSERLVTRVEEQIATAQSAFQGAETRLGALMDNAQDKAKDEID